MAVSHSTYIEQNKRCVVGSAVDLNVVFMCTDVILGCLEESYANSVNSFSLQCTEAIPSVECSPDTNTARLLCLAILFFFQQ